MSGDFRERYAFNQKIRRLVEGLKTPESVCKALKNAGIKFEDVSKEYGYLNIHVPRPNGYVRIYKPYRRDELEVNSFDSVPLTYSGIPTFEPSGRRSL
jgi:hypothetical protein